jgi:hypothetical protein
MSFPVSGGQASPSDLAEAQQTLTDRTEELAVVRAAAGKWQLGLAGLLAIVTGVSGATLGETIRALQQPFGVLVAIGVVAAFGVAVAAIMAALQASGGVPKLKGTPTVGAAHQDAVAAATDLRRAIRLSLVALIVFGLVAATTWFAPHTTDLPVLAQIKTDGRTVCGELDGKTVPGTLLISTSAGSVEIVDLGSMRSWSVVKRCP